MLKLYIHARLFAAEKAEALRRREEGQTMAEYGVVLAVITIAVFVALALLSDEIVKALMSVVEMLSGGTETTTP
jgi:Flp pilus assembly pilin Flp